MPCAFDSVRLSRTKRIPKIIEKITKNDEFYHTSIVHLDGRINKTA